MFPTLLLRRLAQLCAMGLTMVIVCSVAASASTLSSAGLQSALPHVQHTGSSHCPAPGTPAVAYRAVPETGDEMRLMPPLVLPATKHQTQRVFVVGARLARVGVESGNLRPPVLVLRV